MDNVKIRTHSKSTPLDHDNGDVITAEPKWFMRTSRIMRNIMNGNLICDAVEKKDLNHLVNSGHVKKIEEKRVVDVEAEKKECVKKYKALIAELDKAFKGRGGSVAKADKFSKDNFEFTIDWQLSKEVIYSILDSLAKNKCNVKD